MGEGGECERRMAPDQAALGQRFMHQSIPAVPIPPRANPRALAFFKKNWQIPRGGDEERG